MRTLRLAVLPILMSSVFSASADACSCLPSLSPQNALSQSDTIAVFRGRVLRVDALPGSQTERLTTFETQTIWKGGRDPFRTAKTADNSAACGVAFVPGEEYLVYEQKGGMVSLCSRTALTTDAAADLAELGPGMPPATNAGTVFALKSQIATGLWRADAQPGNNFVVEVLDADRAMVYWLGHAPTDPEKQFWMYGLGHFDKSSSLVVPALLSSDSTLGDVDRESDRPGVWGSLTLQIAASGAAQARIESGPLADNVMVIPLTRQTRPPIPVAQAQE